MHLRLCTSIHASNARVHTQVSAPSLVELNGPSVGYALTLIHCYIRTQG